MPTYKCGDCGATWTAQAGFSGSNARHNEGCPHLEFERSVREERERASKEALRG